jgi:ligand-binding SRPBCC domain-containing protein
MAIHSFKNVQQLPVSLEQAWSFFSDPANLVVITPEDMKFKVMSAFHGNKIYPGQIIEYKVSPLLGIPMYWMTEITHVSDLKFFVDEQRKGPYSFWHHQHHFAEIPGGVEMTDIVHYGLPLGFLGNIMNELVVKKKLAAIFQYRKVKVEELLGIMKK